MRPQCRTLQAVYFRDLGIFITKIAFHQGIPEHSPYPILFVEPATPTEQPGGRDERTDHETRHLRKGEGAPETPRGCLDGSRAPRPSGPAIGMAAPRDEPAALRNPGSRAPPHALPSARRGARRHGADGVRASVRALRESRPHQRPRQPLRRDHA